MAFGLQMTSGYRAGDDGWHGQNRARDYSNGFGPTAGMLAFARYLAGNYGSKLLELIYTPLGFGIKNGQVIPNSFWGADILAAQRYAPSRCPAPTRCSRRVHDASQTAVDVSDATGQYQAAWKREQ